MRVIAVTALPDGWKLTIDDISNDLIFRSGREAERAARRLADRLARAGIWSEIRLYLKDGSLAARFLSPGRDAHVRSAGIAITARRSRPSREKSSQNQGAGGRPAGPRAETPPSDGIDGPSSRLKAGARPMSSAPTAEVGGMPGGRHSPPWLAASEDRSQPPPVTGIRLSLPIPP